MNVNTGRLAPNPVVATLALTIFASANPAFAIPSPELVIGSISSISQLFALGAAMLGGGALAVGARAGRKKADANRTAKTAMRAAGVLGVFVIVLLVVNILQFSGNRSENLARLQSTLVRPAQTAGTKILDENLKISSFSAQQSNELGISTQQAAALLASSQNGGERVLFLDVREDAEHQMGTIPGAEHVRFPDLPASKIDLTGLPVVLFCYNGNRSSETCERLAAQGIDCKFIAGGIEKWIIESNEFTDETVRSLSDLRAIPDYKNDQKLLNTTEVKRLIDNDDIQFIDTRYPADFDAGHLPDATNIPLRALPSAEINQRIKALDARPIVVACYDRRSCFMGQVLGLELTKAGFDFRGRYTVPWEYYIPKPLKPHIAAWLAEGNRGLWQKSVEFLAGVVLAVTQQTHFLLAIFGLAVLSRLLIMPISLKAERDQITTGRTAGELAGLKAQHKDDPVRMARAIKSFYAKHGLTPMRNLLALAFLPLMMLGLASVQLAATSVRGTFLWVPKLGMPDPIFILPLIFALLGGVYLHVAVAKSPKQARYYWAIGAPVLFALAFILSAAGNIYLISSLTLLLVQRAYVVGLFGSLRKFAKAATARRKTRALGGLVLLDYPEQLQRCGNKALRLAVLKSAGIAVPGGLVLTTHYLRKYLGANGQARQKMDDMIWHSVSAPTLAVRSSAGSEDGEAKSFAGVFDSFLNVSRRQLGQAIVDVAQSFSSERAGSYDRENLNAEDGNILVQSMVAAEFAGVLFTQDPEAPGLAIIEMVEGTADDLVSGKVIPTTLRFGRFTFQPVEHQAAKLDFKPLLEIGRQAEALFCAPQDMEWTYRDGAFEIVQSRDITTLVEQAADTGNARAEWQRIMRLIPPQAAETRVLERDEMSEVLPRPTPLSLSYMQALWAAGGSVDLACRRLGLTYAPREGTSGHLVTLFGRLYSDVSAKKDNAVRLNRGLIRQLDKNPDLIEDQFYEDFLPDFSREIALLEALDFAALDIEILQEKLAEQFDKFITECHVEVEIVNIVASYYMNKATQVFETAGFDASGFITGLDLAGPAAAFHNAAQLPKERRKSFLLDEVGHRAVFDYELNDPRYRETPDILDSMSFAGQLNAQEPALAKSGSTMGITAEMTLVAQVAGRYQVLKEDVKHHALHQLAVMRKMILALDSKLHFDGGCFFLTLHELTRITSLNKTTMLKLIEQRRAVYRTHMKARPQATSLTFAQLETATLGQYSAAKTAVGQLAGKRVSGSGAITGPAFVANAADAETGAPLDDFHDGDILVCPLVHPAWLPYVLRASGVISEVGGWLSHIAIVAREHNIPMIVGTIGQAAIVDDDTVTLHADGKITIGDTAKWQAQSQAAE